MIWAILLYILGFILAFLAIIVFSPWFLNASLKVKESTTQFLVSAFWINPFIFKVNYDYNSGEINMFLFNIRLSRKKENGKSEVKNVKIEKGKKEETKPDTTDEIILGKKLPDYTTTNDSRSTTESVKDNVHTESPEASADTKKTVKSRSEKTSEKRTSKKKPPLKKTGLLERIKNHPVTFFLTKGPLRKKTYNWIMKIIKSIFKIIRVKKFDLIICAGFEDPSTTGKLYGYIEGIRYAIGIYHKGIRLRYQPTFVNKSVSVEGETILCSSPFLLISPALIAVTTFPYLTFFTTWWEYRKHAKESDSNEKRN